jgi:hypothetical protein
MDRFRSVPSIGYKTCFLTPGGPAQPTTPLAQVSLDRDNDLQEPRRPLRFDRIENAYYRIGVDKATGWVGVFDKKLNRGVCKHLVIVAQEERGTNNVLRSSLASLPPTIVMETSVISTYQPRAVQFGSGISVGGQGKE